MFISFINFICQSSHRLQYWYPISDWLLLEILASKVLGFLVSDDKMESAAVKYTAT